MRWALAIAVIAGCASEPIDPAPAWEWQLPVGFPAPRVPADNPMSAEKVELGRHLFFDPRLSANGTQACASCHDPARAFTDGRTTPLGSTGEVGRHNAMSLANVAYASTQTWASLEPALEAQALVPMFGDAPVELGLAPGGDALLARLAADPVYVDLFAAAFPDDPPSITGVTRAIASFERTLISGGSRFDRFLAGDLAALDATEQRGLAVFEQVGCTRCHGGFDLTSSFAHAGASQVQFFNTGLYNVGGGYPPNDRGLAERTGDPDDDGRFKPPTLRNIAVTAPYMHDGSIATLADVVDHYARGGRRIADGPNAGDGATNPNKSVFVTGFAISADDKAALVAFLGALTDDAFLADQAHADPWR